MYSYCQRSLPLREPAAVTNPMTGRTVRVGGATHQRLVREGILPTDDLHSRRRASPIHSRERRPSLSQSSQSRGGRPGSSQSREGRPSSSRQESVAARQAPRRGRCVLPPGQPLDYNGDSALDDGPKRDGQSNRMSRSRATDRVRETMERTDEGHVALTGGGLMIDREHKRGRHHVSEYMRKRRIVRRSQRSSEHRLQAAAKRSMTGRYSSRPSPSLSATLFTPGSVERGNDGRLWRVTLASNGNHRWVHA